MRDHERGIDLAALDALEQRPQVTLHVRLSHPQRQPLGEGGAASVTLADAGDDGTPLGAAVRRLFERGPRPLAEMFLFMAARNQHVLEKIGPWLRAGRVVLCDRYTDATVAYQGYGRGVDPDLIREMSERTASGYLFGGLASSRLDVVHIADGVWRGDEYEMWVRGRMRETVVFGENLSLTRRISTSLGSSKLLIRDVVVNEGFQKTPHMMLYHCNFGFPLLAEGSELIAPDKNVTARDATAGPGLANHARYEAPIDGYQEQVNSACKTDFNMPIVFFTQMLGVAFGLDLPKLGFGKEIIPAKPVIQAKLGAQAVQA